MESTYPLDAELLSLARAAIPRQQERQRFEASLAEIYSVVGSVNQGWMYQRLTEFLNRILLGDESGAIGVTMPEGPGTEPVQAAVVTFLETDAVTRQYWKGIQKFQDWRAKVLRSIFGVLRLARPEDEAGLLPCIKTFLAGTQLDLMSSLARGYGKSVAFFYPGRSFRGHFGSIYDRLEAMGMPVFYLYGERADDDFENRPNSFYVGYFRIVDSFSEVSLIIVPTILDNIPPNTARMLIDHLSFAEFDPEFQWERMKTAAASHESALTDDALKSKYVHRVQFFPLYDYVVLPSRNFMEREKEKAKFFGYYEVETAEIESSAPKISEDARRLLAFVERKRIAQCMHLIPGGYPKFDRNIQYFEAHASDEKVLTYAPTPNSNNANKDAWYPFMTVNDLGVDILTALLEAFPDYEVVFKPYAGEIPDVVVRIVQRCQGYANFRLDKSGSDYMKLYSRTKVLISDFSSTAYSFAFSTLRPVVFFSKNEAMVQSMLAGKGGDHYVQNRDGVGRVVCTLPQLTQVVTELLSSMPEYEARIRTLRESDMFKVTRSEEYLAQCIIDAVHQTSQPDWIKMRRP